MGIDFLPPDVDELTPRITVIGVGGAGGNAIANMIRAEVQGVEFVVANTDAQALKQSVAPARIQLGAKITQGLGAGSRPEIGRAAAEVLCVDALRGVDQTLQQVRRLRTRETTRVQILRALGTPCFHWLAEAATRPRVAPGAVDGDEGRVVL